MGLPVSRWVGVVRVTILSSPLVSIFYSNFILSDDNSSIWRGGANSKQKGRLKWTIKLLKIQLNGDHATEVWFRSQGLSPCDYSDRHSSHLAAGTLGSNIRLWCKGSRSVRERIKSWVMAFITSALFTPKQHRGNSYCTLPTVWCKEDDRIG